MWISNLIAIALIMFVVGAPGPSAAQSSLPADTSASPLETFTKKFGIAFETRDLPGAARNPSRSAPVASNLPSLFGAFVANVGLDAAAVSQRLRRTEVHSSLDDLVGELSCGAHFGHAHTHTAGPHHHSDGAGHRVVHPGS